VGGREFPDDVFSGGEGRLIGFRDAERVFEAAVCRSWFGEEDGEFETGGREGTAIQVREWSLFDDAGVGGGDDDDGGGGGEGSGEGTEQSDPAERVAGGEEGEVRHRDGSAGWDGRLREISGNRVGWVVGWGARVFGYSMMTR
jgi:hypothetical protein